MMSRTIAIRKSWSRVSPISKPRRRDDERPSQVGSPSRELEYTKKNIWAHFLDADILPALVEETSAGDVEAIIRRTLEDSLAYQQAGESDAMLVFRERYDTEGESDY